MLAASFPYDLATSIAAGIVTSVSREWGPTREHQGRGRLAVVSEQRRVVGVCRVEFLPPHEVDGIGRWWLWRFTCGYLFREPVAWRWPLALGLAIVPGELARRLDNQ